MAALKQLGQRGNSSNRNHDHASEMRGAIAFISCLSETPALCYIAL